MNITKLIPMGTAAIVVVAGCLMNSRPTKAAGQPTGAPVTVVNTSANPVPIVGSANPILVTSNDPLQPFQATVSCLAPEGQYGCDANILTVPVGKRAVVEYFSALSNIPPTPYGNSLSAFISTTLSGHFVTHYLPAWGPVIGQVNVASTVTVGQQVRLYSDPQTVIQVSAYAPVGAGLNAIFSISGYFVNVP